MIASALHGAALGGATTLLVTGAQPPSDTAIWALVITSATGILTQYLRARAEAQREERRHRFEKDDRDLANAQRAVVTAGLAENAALTLGNRAELNEQADRVVRHIDRVE